MNCIIFDFGNVLLNLNPLATVEGFKSRCGIAYDFTHNLGLQDVFRKLEKGEMSEREFYDSIINASKSFIAPEEIEKIWNAMLLDFPENRINMLLELRKKYKVALLSNTNSIHIRSVLQSFEKTYPHLNFEKNLFDQVFFSHEMGDRKPNLSIYRNALCSMAQPANQTIFIDDNLDNVESAKALGIHTYHHNPEEEIEWVIREKLCLL
jgi:glucose-1-phosphatase